MFEQEINLEMVPWEVINCVVLQVQTDALVKANSRDNVIRKRREWVVPAKTLTENKDYTQEDFIAKVSY